MTIQTVTLNPAFDSTWFADRLDLNQTNRITQEIREVGGKGINVGRVLHRFKIPTKAFFLAGRDNIDEYRKLLSDEAGQTAVFLTDGKIRENITLRSGDACIKLNRQGFCSEPDQQQALRTALADAVGPGDMVAVSGSLPVGYPLEELVALCRQIQRNGGLVALDSEALNLSMLENIHPFFLKPNEYELEKLTGIATDTETGVFAALDKAACCGVENMLVSLGERGMAALCKGRRFRVKVPRVAIKSTVGAGDSTVAGFLIGVTRGLSTEDCLRLANACGVAAACEEGTGLADVQTAAQYQPYIQVDPMML